MAELEPAAAARFCADLGQALQALRLNLFFPPWRVIRDHLDGIGHLAPNKRLRLCPSTGWPHPDEWLRVRIDHGLAPEMLEGIAPVEAAGDAPAALKADYLRAMSAASPIGRPSLQVRLVESGAPEPGWSRYEIVHDRMDLTAPAFVRWTIRLAAKDQAGLITDDRGTRRFDALIRQATTRQAVVATAALDADGGLAVEELIRGGIGPVRPGAGLSAVLSRVARSLRRTSVDDPLAHDAVVPDPGSPWGLSHHRKWAVSPADSDGLKDWLRQRGSRNLVYKYRP